jgi:hypothetical protein
MTSTTRKWTATVSVAGQDVSSLLELNPTSDTLRELERSAVALATRMIRDEELGSDASVAIFKQRKSDDEPVRDRSLYVYRDWDANGDAVIRVQR